MIRSAVRVEVTAEDIANGKQCRSDCCPITLAMCRTFGLSNADISVSRDHIIAIKGEEWWSYGVAMPLPPEAKEFVADFDGGSPVAPFAFDVEIPVSPLIGGPR